MRVLLIEESAPLAELLTSALQNEHYAVDTARDGQYGYECASSGIYDIAVLDFFLPKLDGCEVLRRLRGEKNQLPVLILSDKTDLNSKVLAFESGADDFLAKPFEVKELLLRIRAITRRRGQIQDSILFFENLSLDLNNFKLLNRDTGQAVELGGKEFQLMEYLLLNKGQIIKREQIIEKIWGYDTNIEYNSVEVYVSFLRKKIKLIGANVRIRVIRNVGYSLEPVLAAP